MKLVKPVTNTAKSALPYIKYHSKTAIKLIKQHPVGAGLTSTLGIVAIDDYKTKSKLDQERAKNQLYQEALKKHQAELNALKSDIEREKYKNRLWREVMSMTEG